jgi:hypothetical protein
VLRGKDPIGRHKCECSATGPLAEKHRYSRYSERDHFRDTPGDLAGQSAFLCLPRQCRASGVDHGDQRQIQLRGQPHAAAGLSERTGSQRRLGCLAVPILTEQHAGLVAESRECQQ